MKLKNVNRQIQAATLYRFKSIAFAFLCVMTSFSSFAAVPIISAPPVAQTIFIGDSVIFSVGASGTAPLSYQWYRNGAVVSGATSSSLVFTTSADDDTDLFSVQVSNTSGSITSDPAELIIDFGMAGASHTISLLGITDTWKYEVSKTDLGTAWREPSYNDSSWDSGGGLLYVETSDLPAPKTTLLPLTSGSLPTTCYFRTEFPSDITDAFSVRLVANTVVDDGIVLHLNGTGIFTNRMPTGTIVYSTEANDTVGNAGYEGPFNLDGSALIDGDNLLAVEVHQTSSGSSDIVMGLTLDAVWQERVRDTSVPVVQTITPEAGTTVSSLTQIQVVFDEGVIGVDAADLLINGTAVSGVTTNSTSSYLFQFAKPDEGVVNVSWATGHGITDRSAAANAFTGIGFSYLFTPPSPYTQLEFSGVQQSSDASDSTEATKATDDDAGTFSLTQDLPGSWWMAELGRSYELQRVELVNRTSPDDAAMEGLTLSVMNMDDQVVYETVLGNPGSGGVTAVNLPEGTMGRSVRIGLSGSDVNGAGTHEVGFVEVRVVGIAQIPYMPEPYGAGGGSNVEITGFSVSQTTTYSENETTYGAMRAVDGDTGSFSHTDSDTPNNYWIADLGAEGPIARVELVNRGTAAERMDNLVIRILDAGMNSVAFDVTSNPGASATYTFDTPENTVGQYVRVGLENGEENGRDYAIQLAEVRIYSEAADTTPPVPTSNLATDKRSYMLRLHDELEPASNVNDGDMNTEAVTTTQTVDGYWEVDLGQTYALYGVRAVTASSVGDRIESTICRLFDENHDSVLERPVSGTAPSYDVDLDGPVFARYVRIGLEDKTRTDGSPGGFIGFSEVEVFGRPASEVGIQSFNASDTTVSAGQDVTLNWNVTDVHRVEIHPGIGSVGSSTDTNGVGSLVNNMTESSEFIMVATNHAGMFTRAVGVEVNGVSLPVVISEIVADNKYSLEDGYGDASDWIELRNTGNSTVDLTGWGLSDNPEKPMKFTFPSTTIAPHSTLIVFASKTETPIDPAGMLHADFSLDKDGETIVLTAPDGVTTLDSVAYPELDTDLAYGRALDGGWSIMEPTPNAANTGTLYEGWLKTLDWSHKRGFHEIIPFTLTITGDDPEAGILYSLDGTEPSIPYTSGIDILGTSVVRVQAVRPGYKSARIQTKSFIVLDDVVAGLSTSITEDPTYGSRVKPGLLALPTLSVVVSTTGDAVDAIEYDEQACSLEILWPDGQDPIQEDCGIARFGGAYSYFDKKGFSLSFRQKYGNGKLKAPLFNGFDRGVTAKTSFDKLHLRGGNHDFTRSFGMSDRFIQDSYLDMGSLNPHGRYVHLYLNGEYWGQYNLKEVLNESFLADYLGGSSEDYVSVKGNDNGGGGPGGWVIGAGDPPNPEPWERVRDLMGDFEAVSPYLDVGHYIDYMLLYGFGGSENEFRACGPREAGTGFKFWINDPDGFVNDGRVGDDKSIGTYGPGGIWDALHGEGHVDFKTLLADRIYKNFFNDGAMTHAPCSARLLARMDETRDSFLAECARWGRNYTSWENSAETAYTSYFNHQASDMVAEWRNVGYYPSFDPPNFSQYGGPVISGYQPALNTGSGTIYYTLDGTDPRLPGGSISPSALVWSAGAVTITDDLVITTRVRASNGTWSALAEPRYTLASRHEPLEGDLLITEINYNPAGADDYEFIEIWNPGPDFLDLSGSSLNGGVRYVFPEGTSLDPGDFLVIAEDVTLFSDRYQNATSSWYWNGVVVAGEWVGGLSDGGETLTLNAADGSLVSSVSYRTDGAWPERANGDGSTLQLVNPAEPGPLNDGRSWVSSSLYHGSPGRFETSANGVVINELLSHTDVGVDWIEFWNTTDIEVDLGGFAITDDLAWPDRYIIPEGTLIPEGGYLTVSAAVLQFGFSELGAEASLLQLSGTDIVRFVDRVRFPAAQREEPFGRYVRSDGDTDFTELLDVTPLVSNEAPRVGPVVISEIMFAPVLGDPEYIEIVNISGAPVALYDAAIPTNTWGFSGVGDFAFPEGTVLDPAEVALLCSTNPAVFRTRYGLTEDTQVFGPWLGGLALEGEKLQLLSPGDPEFDGFVPMYRADHVTYRTNDAWAVANTGGISLERKMLSAYGNDPVNWKASRLGGTPGSAVADTYNMGLVIVSATGSDTAIAFGAILGESYEVLYTETLTNPDWKTLISIPSATSNVIEVADPAPTSGSRYYRVIWNL